MRVVERTRDFGGELLTLEHRSHYALAHRDGRGVWRVRLRMEWRHHSATYVSAWRAAGSRSLPRRVGEGEMLVVIANEIDSMLNDTTRETRSSYRQDKGRERDKAHERDEGHESRNIDTSASV